MKNLLPASLLILSTLTALAQAPAGIVTMEGTQIIGEALPGSNVVVTVQFKVQKGYYLHSNRPAGRQFTATVLQVGTSPSARALPPTHPAGGMKTIPGVPAPAQVYEDAFAVQVPVLIQPNAAYPVNLPAVLTAVPMIEKTHTRAAPVQLRVNLTIPRPKAPAPKK